jgi:hypothetical protein
MTPSDIGNQGKILNHERNERHEKGMAGLRGGAGVRGQDLSGDSRGVAQRIPRQVLTLIVQAKQRLFSIDDSFRAFRCFRGQDITSSLPCASEFSVVK